MNELYNNNLIVLQNATDKAFELIRKLYDLNYFDKTNYEKNIGDFNIINVNNEEEIQEEFAKYNPVLNKLVIKNETLFEEVLKEDEVCLQVLHGLINMASTDRDNNKYGFVFEGLPFTNDYNDACAWYLAYKLFYGEEFDKLFDKNNDFSNLSLVKGAVDALNEETIFNGFFEGDFKKSIDALSPKELDTINDYLFNINENLKARLGLEEEDALVHG